MKQLRAIILFICCFVFLNQCRYKDNDNLTLVPVKKRLCRNWLMQEALLTDSNNLDLIAQKPWLNNDSLIITDAGVNKINFRTRHLRGWFICKLEDQKRKIKTTPPLLLFEIKITRLTTKELWMEGNAILRLCDRPFTARIKVKYKTAD